MSKLKLTLAHAARLLPKDPVMLRYAVDGILITAGANIVANNNNLFASRLEANDYQLSLLQFLPQLVNLLILIPGGFITDSLRNKQRMVMGSLVAAAVIYLCIGLMPMLFPRPLMMFIGLLSASTGAVMLYNISWQAYFPEVVDIRSRNRVLTLRTQMSVFVGMIIPLFTGMILACIGTTGGKVIAHQGFFFIGAILMLFTSFNFRKLTVVNNSKQNQLKLSEIKKAAGKLVKNKAFLYYTLTALVFYFTWHIDWTLYYIGQQQYLLMNEFFIMLVVVGSTGIQFATMRFWSRKNDRFGVVLPVTFGILGLCLCPLSMIAATSLPLFIAPYAFLLFNTLANFCFATIPLNMFQCLMQVLDDEYRSLSISFFTCLTCMSNAVMPVAGVALYKTLGGDLPALHKTFWIVFVLRIAAASLWLLRWNLTKYQKKKRELH